MKLVKVFVLSLLSIGAMAQSFKVPTKSPSQSIKQEFALSSVEIDYSRPSARGRVIFGDLVPYGALWRTGANNQTLITFGEDVKVNGTALAAGKYSLLSRVGKDSWEILFCKPTTSVFNFKKEDVIATTTAKSVSIPTFYETFTIMPGTQTDNSLDINILWEKTLVSFTITSDIDQKVMSSIDKIMNGDNKPYFAAASYYYDNNKDLTKALQWVNKALDAQPGTFFITHTKAKIQAKMGDKKGAIATAQASLEESKKANNADYIALNEKLIKSLK